MKILNVKFLNINSLRGEWQIHFNKAPLSESGLFAITGPTGAGKSPILDAITVALYGEVPRYGRERPEEIMTRHTAESFSEVEFEANGNRYRSKWFIKRARLKSDGKIQPSKRELINLDTGSIIATTNREVSALVEKLSGLDKKRFLRSVMLAQGDFAAFLRAKDNERGELLEKITGLEIYSQISRFAFEKAKQERITLGQLEGKIDSEQLLSEEQKQELQLQQQEKEKVSELLCKETKTLKAKIDWLNKTAELAKEEVSLRTELGNINKEKERLQPELARLKKHIDIQPLQPDFRLLEDKRSQLVREKSEIAKLKNQLPVLEERQILAEQSVSKKQQVLETAQKNLKKIEPIIIQTRAMDRDIEHQHKQFQEVLAQFDKAFEEFEGLKQKIESQNRQIQELTKENGTIHAWITKNERDKNLEKDIPLIEQMLNALSEAQNNKQQTQGKLAKIQKKIGGLKEKQSEAQRERDCALSQINTEDADAKKSQEKLDRLLEAHSMDELENQKEQQRVVTEQLKRQAEFAQIFRQKQELLKAIKKEIVEIEQNLRVGKDETKKLMNKQMVSEKCLKDLEKIVEQGKLIAKYEENRERLSKGEPCPLCGSTCHPYIEDHYQNELNEDEQRLQEQKNVHQKIIDAYHQQGNLIVELETQQKNQQKQHKNVSEELEKLRSNFVKLNTNTSKSLTIEDREIITSTAELKEQKLEQLTQQVRAVKEQQKIVNAHCEQLNQFRQTVQACKHECNKLEVELESTESNFKQTEEILGQQTQAESSKLTQLTGRLEGYGETSPESENQEQFLKTLKSRSEIFRQKIETESRNKEQLSTWNAELKGLREHYAKSQSNFSNLSEKRTTAGKHLQNLKEERQALFKNKDPQTELEKYRQAPEQAREALEIARKHFTEAQSETDKHQALLETARKRMESNKRDFEKRQANFLDALRKKGFDDLESFRNACLTEDEQEQIERKKKKIEDENTRLTGLIEQNLKKQEAEKKKQLTDKSIDYLEETRRNREKEQKDLLEEIAEINFCFRQDNELQEKYEEVAQEIACQRSVYGRWDALSKLIGSADGSKFSKFAQGLTLARLVDLANQHLKKLNDRYIIRKQVGSDLSLEIMDRYQADTIRPIQSLSGGESFLVSLSLALGLSDLASRENRIDSLFIDEGLGSLDTETLETAISTLENLQKTGKMIGIISHVDALKELMIAQIHVQKQGGGYSTIKIPNNDIPIPDFLSAQ